MATEGFDNRFRTWPGFGLGLVHEHDGNKVVCGVFPGKSASVSGLLCDGIDSDSPALVCNEEVGLLDCVAAGEYCELDIVPKGRTGIHADCQRSVSR